MARNFSVIPSFNEVSKMSYGELRKEFTTLRDIFQKRIKRLAAAGDKRASAFLNGPAAIPTLKELAAKPYMKNASPGMMHEAVLRETEQLINLVGPTSGTVARGATSIIGLRKQRKERDNALVKKLRESGYEHISKSTIKKFGQFMEEMRNRYGSKNPVSEEQAEFFDSLKYNTKRKSTQTLVDLWEDYVNNDYAPDESNIDLFRV